jgi:hypothetical protein
MSTASPWALRNASVPPKMPNCATAPASGKGANPDLSQILRNDAESPAGSGIMLPGSKTVRPL